jgi:hypothetical protein
LHCLLHACNKTSLMHYLSSVYSVTIPLRVLGLLVAHHQEVAMYICDNWYVLYILVDCQLAWLCLDSVTNKPTPQKKKINMGTKLFK